MQLNSNIILYKYYNKNILLIKKLDPIRVTIIHFFFVRSSRGKCYLSLHSKTNLKLQNVQIKCYSEEYP